MVDLEFLTNFPKATTSTYCPLDQQDQLQN